MRAAKIVALSFLAAAFACEASPGWERATLQIGGTTMQLEVAVSLEAKRQGFMFREDLADNTGMLFPFDPPKLVSMWMKNTLIDLDAAFIDGCGEVFQIAHMKAGTLDMHRSVQDTAYVLETSAGWFTRHNIKAGSHIEELRNPKYCTTTASRE